MSSGLRLYDDTGKEIFNSLTNQLFVLAGVHNVSIPITVVGLNTVRVFHPEIVANRTYVFATLNPAASSLNERNSFDSLSMQLPDFSGYVDIRVNFKSSIPSGGISIPIIYKLFRC